MARGGSAKTVSFQRLLPRKGTETKQRIVSGMQGGKCFQRLLPRKGTETNPVCLRSNRRNSGFQRLLPRKGTETFYVEQF